MAKSEFIIFSIDSIIAEPLFCILELFGVSDCKPRVFFFFDKGLEASDYACEVC